MNFLLKLLSKAFNGKPVSKRSGMIGVIILIALAFFFLIWWFFMCCYGWMVDAFPTFEAFPRWAFVILCLLFTSGGSGNASSKK